MSFKAKTCIEIVCDGGCGGPWEDGTPHFDSEAEAVEYARAREWVVTDQRALCPQCAATATCEATGHQWDEWYDASRDGVEIRQRMCDRCSKLDWDPPFKELSAKFQALRDAERIIAEAAGQASRD